MKISKKIFLMGFLAGGIFLTSGCNDVNYETKYESSSSVEVSSSSYKESKSSTSTSTGPIDFKVNDVNFKKGTTEFNFSLTNKTDKDTTLEGITLTFKAVDDNNKVIREGTVNFENLSIKLPAGKEIYENFLADDSKVEAYEGSFNVDYTITNVTLNPPIHENTK